MTNEECVKTVTLDQVTIIASNAEQQLNTVTWDNELNADSRLNADSANSSIRTATPSNNALGRHCANRAPAKSSAIKTSLHLPSSSGMLSLSL